MSDLGHDITEKELKKVEDLISREYRQAAQELTAKMEKHYADFDRKDAEMKAKVDSGAITKQDYKNWRVGQLAIGKRWESVRDSMTDTLVNADKVAADIIRGNSIKAYGENMNYGTYEVEHGSKINTGFSLYDESTVRNLLKDDPKIIPLPKVDIPKDELWNRQKLTSAVTQGILQGESMSGIAKRLSGVAAMDSRAAIRNARTYTTAAENKGRIDSYERANEMGIETKKKWIATLDDRTRVEHRHLDNMVVGNDEDFEVDGYSISYPGDPAAEPEMIYNCRCTLVAEIANYDYKDERNDEKLGDMDYDEWKQAKNEEKESKSAEPAEPGSKRIVVDGSDISDTWVRRKDEFEFEIDDVMEAQGFNGLPKIVSAEEFDKAVKESNFIAQRAYSAPDQETLNAYKDQLYNGKWYVDCSIGSASYGSGMYAIPNYNGVIDKQMSDGMTHYQNRWGIRPSTVETFTLTKDAKMITTSELQDLRKALREKAEEELDKTNWSKETIEKWGFVSRNDDGPLAAILGYDAIKVDIKSASDYQEIVILNRTKLIIKGK